jgi:hypothetical protein
MRHWNPGRRSVECECTSNFTCGYCLRNAPPYLFTPRTWAEIIQEQIYKHHVDVVKEEKIL